MLVLLRTFVLALLCCFAGSLFVQPADARPRRLSYQQRLQKARRLFNQGRLAYRKGDYEEAVLKWQESYELSKKPLIFESIANAYERLGKASSALEYLKKWRKSAPRREHRALDGRIERLEERVRAEEEERLRKEEAERLRKKKKEEARQKRLRDARRKAERAEQRRKAAEDKTALVGWLLTGGGAAAVAAGVIMDVVANSQRPDESTACANRGDQLLCRDALRPEIVNNNNLAIAGDVTWMAGAAMVVSGVVVLLVAGPDPIDDGDDVDAVADSDDSEDSDDSDDRADSADSDDGEARDHRDDRDDTEDRDDCDDSDDSEAMLIPFAGPQGGGLLFQIRF